MKRTYLPLLSLSILGCNSGRITDSDLSGKAYQVKVAINYSQRNEYSQMTDAILAHSQVELKFDNGGQGTYKTTIGAMANSQGVTWQIKGDSLALENTPTDQKPKDTYLIERAKGGYTLKGKSATLELTEISD